MMCSKDTFRMVPFNVGERRMTGKLIKYEIRSSIKMMAVIWAALIAVSVLFSLSINFLSDLVIDSGNGINTIVGIVEIITGIMYFAVFVLLL